MIERGTAELSGTKIIAAEFESVRLQQEVLFGFAARLATEPALSVEAAGRPGVADYERVIRHAYTAEALRVLIAAVLAHAPA